MMSEVRPLTWYNFPAKQRQKFSYSKLWHTQFVPFAKILPFLGGCNFYFPDLLVGISGVKLLGLSSPTQKS